MDGDDEGGNNDARRGSDESGDDAHGSDDEGGNNDGAVLLVRGEKEDTQRSLNEKGKEWARDGLTLDKSSVLYKNFKEHNVSEIRIFYFAPDLTAAD